MTSQSYFHKYPNTISNVMHSPYQTNSKQYSNANFNQQNTQEKKSYFFDFDMQKAFISKEKQWLNSLQNPQANFSQSVIGNTVTKPNSSSLVEQKRSKIDSNYEFEQNLAKTVKHSALPYKKIQPEINPEHFKTSSIYGEPQRIIQKTQNIQSNTSKLASSHNQASQKHLIMSIDQIREVEKKQFSEKIIHKITSSMSRNKLKSSSSKDSKGSSVNMESKSIKLNGQTERYNKYINSELININIDLRKETPNNMIVPNLNVRRFGGSQPLSSQNQPYKMQNHLIKSRHVNQTSRLVLTVQGNYTPLRQNFLPERTKASQNEELAYRDSIPREDTDQPLRIKTRSKSNLSRYSQLKDQHKYTNKQCLVHCEEKIILQNPKETEIIMDQILQKSLQNQTIPGRKSEKRIQFITYSSGDKYQDKTSKITKSLTGNYHTELSGHMTSRDSKRQEMQKIPIQFSGMKKSQQKRVERPQTERKSITNFNLHPQNSGECRTNALNQLIEEKIRKKPIRLTIQKKN